MTLKLTWTLRQTTLNVPASQPASRPTVQAGRLKLASKTKIDSTPLLCGLTVRVGLVSEAKQKKTRNQKENQPTVHSHEKRNGRMSSFLDKTDYGLSQVLAICRDRYCTTDCQLSTSLSSFLPSFLPSSLSLSLSLSSPLLSCAIRLIAAKIQSSWAGPTYRCQNLR